MNGEKTGIKARVAAETKSFVLLFVYLALLLGAFTTYRRLLLAEYDIPYLHYGYAVFEAFVLAKVILVGRFLRLGERFGDRPLVVPTLYKSLCFAVFILAFSVAEDVVAGLWHGETAVIVLHRIVSEGLWEALARVVILFSALVPLFAIGEAAGVIGADKLFALFFKRRTKARSATAGSAAI